MTLIPFSCVWFVWREMKGWWGEMNGLMWKESLHWRTELKMEIDNFLLNLLFGSVALYFVLTTACVSFHVCNCIAGGFVLPWIKSIKPLLFILVWHNYYIRVLILKLNSICRRTLCFVLGINGPPSGCVPSLLYDHDTQIDLSFSVIYNPFRDCYNQYSVFLQLSQQCH